MLTIIYDFLCCAIILHISGIPLIPRELITIYIPKILMFVTSGREFTNVRKRHPYLKEASSFSSSSEREYDYIIVGGGTAGCPLAATFSRKFKVLLLERGGSPYGNLNISRLQNFHISLADTSPSSPSQPFISTDGVINTRARVLGGGSCLNAGFYSRASPRYGLTIFSICSLYV